MHEKSHNKMRLQLNQTVKEVWCNFKFFLHQIKWLERYFLRVEEKLQLKYFNKYEPQILIWAQPIFFVHQRDIRFRQILARQELLHLSEGN